MVKPGNITPRFLPKILMRISCPIIETTNDKWINRQFLSCLLLQIPLHILRNDTNEKIVVDDVDNEKSPVTDITRAWWRDVITRIFLASVEHKHATNFMHLATTDTWNQQGATFFLLSSMNIIRSIIMWYVLRYFIYYVLPNSLSQLIINLLGICPQRYICRNKNVKEMVNGVIN